MNRREHRWRYAALALMLVFAAWFALPQAAQADWILAGDTIPTGQTVDNDVLLTGTEVLVDGTVQGDALAVGSTVTINGTVEGSLVAVGRTVTINGQVGGSVYAAGRVLVLGPSSEVQGNLHYAGLLLDSLSGSRVARDLVVASVRGQISGEIGRALRALILLLTFDGKIGQGAQSFMEQPETGTQPADRYSPTGHGAAQTRGTPFFVSLGGHKVGGYAAPTLPIVTLARFQDEVNQAESPGGILPEWLIARTGEFVTLLIVGLLAIWLIPLRLKRWADRIRVKPVQSLGFGLLAVAIFANALFIAALLAVLIFFVGMWLGSVALWTLAFLFWGLAYSSLVFVLSAFALTVFFGSKVVVAYLLGTQIVEWLAPRWAEYRVLLLLLGLVLYILLRSIPILGWVIEALAVIFGLGALWVAFRDRKELTTPQDVEVG